MTDYNINIKPIELDDIVKYHKEKYNSNNHWENGIFPSDYDEILSKSDTDKWIKFFKPECNIIEINNVEHIKLLKEFNKVCGITGNFSKLFTDELEQILNDLSLLDDKLINELLVGNGKGYFVRVNNVSLKHGFYGVGPYNNLKNILISTVSSMSGHSPINDSTDKLLIYLIDWVEIPETDEFRVFVFENKITAISQQNLYKRNGLHLMNNLELKTKIDIIINYFNDTISKKINWISNYSYDFAIINDKPYFIEMNSFGKEYAAGSALFHWILDENILYNKSNNNIEFRYTI